MSLDNNKLKTIDNIYNMWLINNELDVKKQETRCKKHLDRLHLKKMR